MSSKQIIDREISSIGISDQTGIFWYFYGLLLDDKPCAKFGKSTVHLGKRIHSYLEIEHKDQKKDWDSFRLICVMQFRRRTSIKHVEELIKDHAREHPFHEKQHPNTEQYNLKSVWGEIRGFIEKSNFPFAQKIYCAVNPNIIIETIVKKASKITHMPIKKPQITEISHDTNTKIMLERLNKMSVDDFQQIHGIGGVIAEQLALQTPYKDLESIRNVRMIGQKRYDAIMQYLKS